MPRRIRQAKVKFLSLCPRGANGFEGLYKSDDGRFEIGTLLKDDDFEEKGELIAVVYAPDVEDKQGDSADAEVIRKMAHDFSRNGMQVDLRHNEKPLTKDQAYIAESFIIQKGDERFANQKDADGNAVDVVGGWAVIAKIDDPELRRLYREGKWSGVSMGGVARFEKVEKEEDAPSWAKRLVNSLRGSVYLSGDIDMKPEDLTSLLKQNNEALIAGFGESLTKTLEPLTKQAPADDKNKDGKDSKPERPKFEGDLSKAEDIEAFEKEVKVWEIKKDLDMTDPAALKKANEAIAKILGDEPAERRPSNQSASPTEPVRKEGDATEEELAKESEAIAKMANGGR